MLYYRMTNKHDCYYPHKNITIVYNELKTAKELEKLNICKDSACFERIYTSRKNTFFSFGCRFVKDENKIFQERKTMKDLITPAVLGVVLAFGAIFGVDADIARQDREEGIEVTGCLFDVDCWQAGER